MFERVDEQVVLAPLIAHAGRRLARLTMVHLDFFRAAGLPCNPSVALCDSIGRCRSESWRVDGPSGVNEIRRSLGQPRSQQ